MSNRFGKRLFNLFFKSYTEKVWGVPTSEIRAEWAAQRIKGLSFFSAAKAFFGNRGDKIKSLISEFNYPRYGPGQMWETMADDIQQARRPGAPREAGDQAFEVDKRALRARVGRRGSWEPSAVISSLALRNTVGIADPHPKPEVLAAAKGCATATS